MRRLCFAILFSAAGFVPAAGAACPQELAVYGEAQAGATIAFEDDLHPAEPLMHRFTVSFPENAVEMDGMVMLAGEPPRVWGMVLHKCPLGDATGAEIDACTVWEGPVYGIDEMGNVSALPEAGLEADAMATVLLADFSAAVRLSSAWGAEGLSAAPKDDFRLSGCRQ